MKMSRLSEVNKIFLIVMIMKWIALLRLKADLEKDIEVIVGRFIQLVPSWLVLPK